MIVGRRFGGRELFEADARKGWSCHFLKYPAELKPCTYRCLFETWSQCLGGLAILVLARR
jgi:hypothetical protein